MKKTFLKVLFLFLLTSCTTEYLKDSADFNDKVGYEKFSSDDISYKEGKRKKVTVMKPLIESTSEKAPDLVALPVEKVSVVEIEKIKKSKENDVDVSLSEQQEKKGFFKEALDILKRPFESDFYKESPDEKEEIAKEPPKSPEIKEKLVSPSVEDIVPLIENDTKKDEEYSNILTLINSLKFKEDKSNLSNDDFEKIKEAAEIQKEDGGRIKVIIYSPFDYEKSFEEVLKTRKDNIVVAINNFGINKEKLVSVIEKTDSKILINSAEIYIEY